MKFPNPFSRMSFTTPTIIAADQTPTPYQIAKGLELAAQFNLIQPQPQETQMTFLQHVGSIFKKILHIGEEAAIVAQPFIAAEFPQILPIYSSALGLATAAEATAASTTGTGPQKLAQVVANLTPQIEEWAKQNGIVWDQAGITKWTSALVDTLNLIPAPSVAPVPPIPSPNVVG